MRFCSAKPRSSLPASACWFCFCNLSTSSIRRTISSWIGYSAKAINLEHGRIDAAVG
jgi:hypothetical protein